MIDMTNQNKKQSLPIVLYGPLAQQPVLEADAVRNMARRLGITRPLGHDLSLAFGTSEFSMLEMAGACQWRTGDYPLWHS